MPDFGIPKFCTRGKTHRPDFGVVELGTGVLGLKIYVTRELGG
jgi:hypothetical protein